MFGPQAEASRILIGRLLIAALTSPQLVGAEQITSTCPITAAVAHTVTLVRKTASGERTGIAKVADGVKVTIDGQSAFLGSLRLPVDATVVYDTAVNAVVEMCVGTSMATVGPTLTGATLPLAIAPFDAAKTKECQEAWAKHLGVPVEVTNSIGMRLVLVPPGEFDMGSSPADIKETLGDLAPETGNQPRSLFRDTQLEGPLARVRVESVLYMGAYEVTRGEFRKFVEATGYQTDAEKGSEDGQGWDLANEAGRRGREFTWRHVGADQDDTHPVVNVTWNDATAFCRWLSATEKKTYRLPGEAEWEYACRAGTQSRWASGDRPESLRLVANVNDSSFHAAIPKATASVTWDDGFPFTAPCGRFQSNAFGLYDMVGNVWELCQDWQKGFENKQRAVKGSSFGIAASAYRLRPPCRAGVRADECAVNIGFRVAASVVARE